MRVLVDDRPRETHTDYQWNRGGTVLSISTVLPERELAVELVSTYVGHRQTDTIATHLMLGPAGHLAQITSVMHRHEQLDPVERARQCVYDHAQHLIETLASRGRTASVELEERSFAALEAIE